MSRVGAILLSSIIFVTFSTDGQSGQRQSESQLNALIPGSTVEGKMAGSGRAFVVIYHPDGRLSGRSGSATDEGRWEIVSNQICFQWKTWRDAKRHCVFLEKDGDGMYSSYYEDGRPSASGRYTR